MEFFHTDQSHVRTGHSIPKSNRKNINAEPSRKFSSDRTIDQVLKEGQKVPELELINAEGELVSLTFPRKNFTLIHFYRGSWCPYAHSELLTLQRVYDQTKARNIRFVAISPQDRRFALGFKSKYEINYDLLSDPDYQATEAFNLVYTVPSYLHQTYMSFGVDSTDFDENDQLKLPIPATYLLDPKGRVIKRLISSNSGERIDDKQLIRFLKRV